ncbi:hypothetical protein ACYOEI_39160, partial [Singulisphaera rosea]
MTPDSYIRGGSRKPGRPRGDQVGRLARTRPKSSKRLGAFTVAPPLERSYEMRPELGRALLLFVATVVAA